MTRFTSLACGLALLTLASAPAGAQLVFPSRTSSTLVRTTAKDFSDVSATITATTQVAKGSTGQRDLDFFASSTLTSLSTRATGDVAVRADIVDVNYDGGYTEIAGAAIATGPNGGSFTIVEGYGRGSSPYDPGPLYRYADGSVFHDPANGFLPAFTETGLPAIEFFLPIGGAGLVDQGGEFVAELLMPGDYSTTGWLGSGTGQHYLAHLNPAWTVTQDFTYDPATNLTTFRAVNPSYDYDDPDPFGLELDVFFFGAPAAVGAVPEPATWASMIAGVALAGAALRRGRRTRRRTVAACG